MDPLDILGGLLGKKSGGGLGGKILKDILGGNSPSEKAERTPPRNTGSRSTGAPSTRPGSASRDWDQAASLEQQARELEELLNVANHRASNSRTASTSGAKSEPPRSSLDINPVEVPGVTTDPRSSSNSQRFPAPSRGTRDSVPPPPPPKPPQTPPPGEASADHALVMIRAMIRAAKADGKLSSQEQQQLLEQVGRQDPEAIRFLQSEFNRQDSVRDFVWSVPLGYEQQVYMMSVLGMDLQTKAEKDYLAELAHGLRLPVAIRRDIHQRLGIPGDWL